MCILNSQTQLQSFTSKLLQSPESFSRNLDFDKKLIEHLSRILSSSILQNPQVCIDPFFSSIPLEQCLIFSSIPILQGRTVNPANRAAKESEMGPQTIISLHLKIV